MRSIGSTLAVLASISRLHIVAIGGLGTLTFGWLFLGVRPFDLAAWSALDWFLVNLANRAVDLAEDRENQVTGTGFVARHRRVIVVACFALLGGSLVLGARVAPAIVPLRLAFHALGLAYNWPLLPGRRRIKQLYFFKNTASATGFMLTVFGYPLAIARSGPGLAPGVEVSTVLVAAAFFFLFELSYEVIYDLRDATGDARAGVRTYPVVHGERGAARIVVGLLLSSAGILAAGFVAGLVPWRIFIMIAAPVAQLGYFQRARLRGISSRDCVAITWMGALLLAVYHVWGALGLPGAA